LGVGARLGDAHGDALAGTGCMGARKRDESSTGAPHTSVDSAAAVDGTGDSWTVVANSAERTKGGGDDDGDDSNGGSDGDGGVGATPDTAAALTAGANSTAAPAEAGSGYMAACASL
jgi:hypothetical protein